MELVLTEEQTLLQNTARDFVAKNSSLRRIRALRDSRDPLGFSPELWTEMAKLGWLGIIFPEAYGGAGLGCTDLMVVLEEMGRGLMPEPILSSVLLGGCAVALGGSQAQKDATLPPLINGNSRLTLAYQEPHSRYDPLSVQTRATQSPGGWRLSGEKVHVLDGCGADHIIVSARTAGGTSDQAGITLFLIDAHAPGLSIEPQWRIDSRNAARVLLHDVTVRPDAVLGTLDAGGDVLVSVIDRATIGLCAEMLGSMTAALEMTLDYLKTRVQFGAPIGSFQALKHRAAKMYIETELARSVVWAAHKSLDERSPGPAASVGSTGPLPVGSLRDATLLASIAKARCSDAFILIANETIQMHGGIGMTDEHDSGFFLKRARVAEITFGDAAYHRNRFAELHGY
jgi:alkylation response protein AidB-like acyl-CoA dehydrogenase